jgi:hypothetical protein
MGLTHAVFGGVGSFCQQPPIVSVDRGRPRYEFDSLDADREILQVSIVAVVAIGSSVIGACFMT